MVPISIIGYVCRYVQLFCSSLHKRYLGNLKWNQARNLVYYDWTVTLVSPSLYPNMIWNTSLHRCCSVNGVHSEETCTEIVGNVIHCSHRHEKSRKLVKSFKINLETYFASHWNIAHIEIAFWYFLHCLSMVFLEWFTHYIQM